MAALAAAGLPSLRSAHCKGVDGFAGLRHRAGDAEARLGRITHGGRYLLSRGMICWAMISICAISYL